MQKFVYPFLAILIFNSCAKQSDSLPPPEPPVVIQPDTLTAGWTKVSMGTSQVVTDIFFIDNSNGFGCSQDGIFRSTNGGSNWTRLNVTASPINIAMISPTRASFVEGTDKIFLTTDGSTVQMASSLTLTPPAAFKDVFFSSASVCYAASGIYLWKSVNGGANFDTVYNFKNPGGAANATLFFLNDLTGFITRNDSLYKTTNGGINWTFIFKGVGYPDRFAPVEFVDANTGFYVSGQQLFKTTNGGTSFQNIYTIPEDQLNIFDIDFVSPTVGYVSASNHIYKTTDGGTTWTQLLAVGSPQKFFEIHFTDATHGWACGTNGLVLKFN